MRRKPEDKQTTGKETVASLKEESNNDLFTATFGAYVKMLAY